MCFSAIVFFDCAIFCLFAIVHCLRLHFLLPWMPWWCHRIFYLVRFMHTIWMLYKQTTRHSFKVYHNKQRSTTRFCLKWESQAKIANTIRAAPRHMIKKRKKIPTQSQYKCIKKRHTNAKGNLFTYCFSHIWAICCFASKLIVLLLSMPLLLSESIQFPFHSVAWLTIGLMSVFWHSNEWNEIIFLDNESFLIGKSMKML